MGAVRAWGADCGGGARRADQLGRFWAHARVSALQEHGALLTRLLGLEALTVMRDEEMKSRG